MSIKIEHGALSLLALNSTPGGSIVWPVVDPFLRMWSEALAGAHADDPAMCRVLAGMIIGLADATANRAFCGAHGVEVFPATALAWAASAEQAGDVDPTSAVDGAVVTALEGLLDAVQYLPGLVPDPALAAATVRAMIGVAVTSTARVTQPGTQIPRWLHDLAFSWYDQSLP